MERANLKKVEHFLLALNRESIQFKILKLMFYFLRNLSFKVELYSVESINSLITIEILNKEINEFTSVELNKSNLEIRGVGFEFIAFLEDVALQDKFNILISSFFEGEYKITSYFDKHKKKVAFGMAWNKPELSFFDKKYETVTFFKKNIEYASICDGIKLIQ